MFEKVEIFASIIVLIFFFFLRSLKLGLAWSSLCNTSLPEA